MKPNKSTKPSVFLFSSISRISQRAIPATYSDTGLVPVAQCIRGVLGTAGVDDRGYPPSESSPALNGNSNIASRAHLGMFNHSILSALIPSYTIVVGECSAVGIRVLFALVSRLPLRLRLAIKYSPPFRPSHSPFSFSFPNTLPSHILAPFHPFTTHNSTYKAACLITFYLQSPPFPSIPAKSQLQAQSLIYNHPHECISC